MLARGSLLLSAMALVPSFGLSAQGAGRFTCRTDSLATYNCAQYYSGTVTISGELSGPGVRQSLKIEATVTAGRVLCKVNGTDEGQFEAAGMLAVEHAAANAVGGGYTISLWCPESADSRVSRDDAPVIVVMNQRATDYAALSGRDEHEHPNTDAVNGLTGKETITWALRRS